MVMSATNANVGLSSQMQQIRQSWSPQERHDRAVLGRLRQAELLELIEGIPAEPDHWAVGAPMVADLGRLAS